MKRNAAKFGLIAGILCFVLGAFVFDRPWGVLICFVLAGGIASVLPAIWGTRLVRIGGIGCCIICFSATAITFFQAQGIDALLQRKWDRRQTRNATYAELKKLPPVAKDFTTPEGAILCLEDAYRRRDIEAAVAAKDFMMEARLMLQKTGFKSQINDEMIAKTAEALVASFRAHTTASWPDFEGVESFFTKRESYEVEKVVLVNEMCRFPDGGFSQQQILVVETPQGWRVLNPVSK